jgi:hypothetical protein
MNDYRIIQNSKEQRRLEARDPAWLHRESVAWLQHELGQHDPSRTIVVTHHSPSFKSEATQYVNGPLAPAFSSDLDALIEASGIPLWIHGHMLPSSRLSDVFQSRNQTCLHGMMYGLGKAPWKALFNGINRCLGSL